MKFKRPVIQSRTHPFQGFNDPQIAEKREARMPLTKQQHFDREHGPKRVLSLDGGGIRGILTLEFLAVIEDMIGIDRTAGDLAKIAEMDNSANMEPLAKIGQKAATAKPEPDHFPAGFNIA
jgi:hypothetical protein